MTEQRMRVYWDDRTFIAVVEAETPEIAASTLDGALHRDALVAAESTTYEQMQLVAARDWAQKTAQTLRDAQEENSRARAWLEDLEAPPITE